MRAQPTDLVAREPPPRQIHSRGTTPVTSLTQRILPLLKEIAEHESLTLRVDGHCMEPTVHDGAQVTVQRGRAWWPGDVIAVQTTDGRILLHRCLGYVPTREGLEVLTQADTAHEPDRRVAVERVIGRLAGAPRPTARERMGAMRRYVRWAKSAAARRLRR